MAYVPINTQAYVSAYAGAIAGMAVSGWIVDSNSSEYTNVAIIAGAFAEAFDTVWNDVTALNWLQIQSIQSVCQEQFTGHAPGSLDNPSFTQVANWAIPASACAALALEGDAYVLSQGITPGTPGAGGAGVDSFNARTGVVTSADGDYDTDQIDNVSGVTGATCSDALDTLAAAIAAIPPAPVTSVFTRTGAVSAASGDYDTDQVDNASGVTGATCSDALDTLAAAIAAIPPAPVTSVFTRTGAVTAASGDYNTGLVTNTSGVAGATCSAALDTLAAAIAAIPPAPVTSVFTRTGAVTAVSGDYNTGLVTNTSGVAGSTCSDALNTLSTAISAITTNKFNAAWGTAAAPGTPARFMPRTNAAVVTTTPACEYPCEVAGTFNWTLTWRVSGTMLVTDSVTATVMFSNVATVIVAVIPANTRSGQVTFSATVAMGDGICIRLLQSASEVQAAWNANFTLRAA